MRIEALKLYSFLNAAGYDAHEKSEHHGMLILEKQPNNPQLEYFPFGLSPKSKSFQRQSALWRTALDKYPTDLQIVSNALPFLVLFERELALRLVDRAVQQVPDDPNWWWHSALLHSDFGLMDSKPEKKHLESAINSLNRYRELYLKSHEESRSGLALARVETQIAILLERLGRFDESERSAKRAIDLVSTSRSENAKQTLLHVNHITLGLVALSRGRIEEAVGFLDSAGKLSANISDQFSGPDLSLASRLLDRNRVDTVSKFLSDLYLHSDKRVFGAKIEQWKRSLKSGKKPQLPDLRNRWTWAGLVDETKWYQQMSSYR